MTKKEHELIAGALLRSRPADLYSNSIARGVWYDAVTEIATALGSANRRFDANRFFDNAGVPT